MKSLLLCGLLPACTAIGAQQPPLVRESTVASGRAATYRISSGILKQQRRVRIALPPSFDRTGASRRYPVLVVLDGESAVSPAIIMADELARNGQVPETIVVGIENIGDANARVYDLTPPGLSVSGSNLEQGGDRFLDFIERELLPEVDRQFRGATPRILIGHSSGALLATYAAATRNVFAGVIAIDGPVSLQENWLADRLIARARSRPGSPLRFAAYEARFSWPVDAWQRLVGAAPGSWTLRRDAMRLEGHETVVFPAIYHGLREIFSDYSRLAGQEKPAPQVLPYYDALRSALGEGVVAPRQLLRSLVDDLVAAGEASGAKRAFGLLVAGYGAPPDSALLESRITAVEQAPVPTETVESLLATPFPRPNEVEGYIGEWVGSIWMTPTQPRNNQITLRLRLDGDRVIAETRNAGAPPEMAGWRPVDYLRATPAGLTYGYLNGMRPRGVMMWEGALRGDTLSGKGRWGGIVFEAPPGYDPGFSFVRKRQ